MLRFHTQTGGVTLTAQQPDNNIVRTALQALAAVLGGTQSLHTNSLDEALGLPSKHAVEVALRTQQIIAHESGVADIVDPLGGASCIEEFTDAIEVEATRYIEEIDSLGGAVVAIEAGYQQRKIMEAAYRWQVELEVEAEAALGEDLAPGSAGAVKVGVNRFVTADPTTTEIVRVDPEVGRRQAEKLERLRAARDTSRAAAAIDQVRQAAAGDANLMAPIGVAVKADVTLGEIADGLRAVWGEHRESVII